MKLTSIPRLYPTAGGKRIPGLLLFFDILKKWLILFLLNTNIVKI